MSDPATPRVRIVEVRDVDAGQRIDNFLLKQVKGVPRARIYKALRKGEVRVNGARKKPTYQIVCGDQIRIPPLRQRVGSGGSVVPENVLEHIPVLFEDDTMVVVNKPSGLAVHGGSGIAYGLIEAMRERKPEYEYLELVHRLDRETSGCLMLAKSRQALVGLQSQLTDDRSMRKYYVALLKGIFDDELIVTLPLAQVKDHHGLKRMAVNNQGQSAHTVFRTRKVYSASTLADVELKTGRMHQVRVHAASCDHPVAGDRLYGDSAFNTQMNKLGNRRLFLHAERLRIRHPISGTVQDFYAPLPDALERVIEKL